MIIINNNIVEESCQLFGPNDQLVGVIENSLAFYDVRVQIKKQGLEDYYILFKGVRYYIDKDGKLPIWPIDLFVKEEEYLQQLIGW